MKNRTCDRRIPFEQPQPRCVSWFLALLLVGAISTQARAGTFNIANGDVTSLKTVISASNSNDQDDVINLAQDGTYVLTTIEDTTYGPAGLPLISSDRGHTLTINGNGATILRNSGDTFFRIVSVDSAANVGFNNLVLTGGFPSDPSDNGRRGGAIFNDGTLVLNSCLVTGSAANDFGGGIFNFGQGSLTLNGCTISNNHNDSSENLGEGGGVENWGTLTVNNSTFQNNNSGIGGGIGNSGGTLSVRGCTFISNGGSPGSAISDIVPPTSATIQNCTFVANTGSSTVYHKSEDFKGGLTVYNCTFSFNSVNTDLDDDSDDATVSPMCGSCIFDESPSLASVGGNTTSQGYNISSDNLQGVGTSTDQTNIHAGLDPAGLQYNGGLTQTIALVFASPAIDHGNSFGATTDQRGNPRKIDNPGVSNSSDGADVGAYEAPLDPLQDYNPFGAYIVTSFDDHDDGVCGAQDCTLREAIERAELTRNVNNISFLINGTCTLKSGLDVTGSGITIIGLGAGKTILSGGGTNRLFFFSSGISTISNLTLNDGNAADSNDHGEPRRGGAVYNQARVTFQSCEFIGDTVTGASNVNNGGAGGLGQGGAIFNTGSGNLGLIDCTFAANSATGSAGNNYTSQNGLFAAGGVGGAGQGGAIYNDTNATLTIQDCTFASNSATGGAAGTGSVGPAPAGGGDGTGAAIFNQGNVHITSATISGNSGSGGNGAKSGPFSQGPRGGGNGGVYVGGGTTQMMNTILAANSGNTAPDAAGAFTSNGHNLVGIADQSSGFGSTGDQLGSASLPINPHLGPLQNNGGGTDTMALLNGSSAHDAGSDNADSTDQRGLGRSDILGTDIGAVQMNILAGPDSDGDGMSDDFERFYGFNPNNSSDAAIDSDGDGMTNLQEFQAGTNPLDPNSRLAIASIAKSGNTVTILFGLGVTSKTYRLERTSSLKSPVTWMPVSDQTIDGASGTFTFTDPNAGSTPYFYHVILLP